MNSVSGKQKKRTAAARAMLPSVAAALGYWPDGGAERLPDARRGEGIGPITIAAVASAADPGTEVSATEVAGQPRGPRGRWAVLLRRRQEPATADDETQVTATASPTAE